MPLVRIRYKDTVDHQSLRALLPVVCGTVADQLSCTNEGEEIKITPNMVKIRFDAASELDTNMPDIFLEVEARALRVRMNQKEEYAKRLGEAIALVLPP